MKKIFLVINNKEEKKSDFFLICHAACSEIGNFQWFLKDNLNDDVEYPLDGEVYESLTICSDWIKKYAENKWLGCHCLLQDKEYTEIMSYLSSDILTLLRNNTLDMIDVFDQNGNSKDSYKVQNRG